MKGERKVNLGNVASVIQMAYQKANQTQRASVSGNDFASRLQEAKDTNMSKVDAYTEQLRSKFGNVMIMSVGKDQNSMDNLGMGTSGYSNVVIAPNILEQMANDPEKAAYYEEKIQQHFDSIPETEAFMKAMGHVTTSCGVVIHEDGSVTYYLSGEEGPEKKAEFETAQKAKREKKAEKRREEMERSKEIAETRRQELESQYRYHMMEQMSNGQIFNEIVAFCYLDSSQVVTPSYSAYERAISSISSNVISGI